MAIPTSTILRLAAAGTLVGGVTLALGASRAPVGAAGLDAAQIRQLAASVEAQQARTGAFAPLDVPVVPAPVPQVVRPVKPAVPAPRMGFQPPELPKPGASVAANLAKPAPPQPAPRPTPAPPAAPEDPAKNVALLGITHANGEDSAWLVDLRDQEREILEVGEQAFGFTLKEIEEDHVVLSRGGDKVTLHLGEKRIASNSSSGGSSAGFETLGSSGAAGPGGDGEGRGRGFGRGGGFAGGMGGFGGRGAGMSGFGGGGFGGGFSGFGGRSRSGRGGFSASSNSGGSSFGGSSGGGNSYSGSSGNQGSFGGRSSFSGGSNSGGFGRSTGGFGGGSGSGRNSGFGGSGFAGGGQNGGGSSQFSSTSAVTSTPNPQTARRRGARLSGDADPIETPNPVSNPQTTRRLGTSSSGAAFGQNPGGRR